MSEFGSAGPKARKATEGAFELQRLMQNWRHRFQVRSWNSEGICKTIYWKHFAKGQEVSRL